MAQFRPQVTIITDETVRDARNSYPRKSPYKTVSFKTYRELKKNLPKIIRENLELPVTVTRSKRGEWGEWFENWQLVGGKPEIVKEGWM